MTRPVIIDTDCGVDDALAILMALVDPAIEVVGITCVAGNVGLGHVVRNVATVCDAALAPAIPIFRGASRPLLMAPVDAASVHGADGLGDVGFAPSTRPIDPEPAAAALVRLARAHPGATLVPLGPLTNVALALALEPELPQLLGATVLMGGAVRGTGNASPAAEFNIYADPEAAALCFARGLNPVVLDWDLTLATPIAWPVWDAMVASGPLGRHFIGPINARLRERSLARGGRGINLPDPKAMAIVLDPAVARLEPAALAVDTGWSAARGMTTVDRRWHPAPPNCQLATELDMSRLLALVERTCQAPSALGS